MRAFLQRWHHHVYCAVIAALLVTNTLSFFGGVLAHDGVVALGGALVNQHKRVAPNRSYVLKGAAASPSYSLAQDMPGTLQQGPTMACGAFSVAEAIYAELRARGEIPATLSPWWIYWHVTAGANVPTSFDQDAQASEGQGSVAYSAMPSFGAPPAGLAPRSYGGSYEYLFYQPAGSSGVDAIKGAIASGHPVVLLLQVRGEFYNDFGGQASSNNAGGFMFNHFVVADAYSPAGIEIQNSWGSTFGIGGKITLTYQAVMDSVLAAGILHPGAVGWPPQASGERRAATATATLTPRPTPFAWPTAAPRPTLTPVARRRSPEQHSIFRVVHSQFPRALPRADSHRGQLVRAGTRLRYAGRQTPHWVQLRPGWFVRVNATCVSTCRRLR